MCSEAHYFKYLSSRHLNNFNCTIDKIIVIIQRICDTVSEWILGRLRECRVDPVGSGQGPVVCFSKYDEELSGSDATVLVSYMLHNPKNNKTENKDIQVD
jgi:hypothetical protein